MNVQSTRSAELLCKGRSAASAWIRGAGAEAEVRHGLQVRAGGDRPDDALRGERIGADRLVVHADLVGKLGLSVATKGFY